MKKILILITTLFILGAEGTLAQSNLEHIIQQNIRARGGEELLKNLNSIEMKMSMENKMGEITARSYVLNNQASRMEMDIMGTTNYFIVDQNGGWSFFPVQGMKEPKKMDDETYMKMRNQMDVNGELFNYQEKDQMIEFSGTEIVKDVECVVLTVMSPDRPESPKKIYISTEDFLIVKEVVEVEGPEGLMTVETLYKDYKRTDEGYTFPMTIISPQGTAVIKKIKINGEINPELFTVKATDPGEHDEHEGHNH